MINFLKLKFRIARVCHCNIETWYDFEEVRTFAISFSSLLTSPISSSRIALSWFLSFSRFWIERFRSDISFWNLIKILEFWRAWGRALETSVENLSILLFISNNMFDKFIFLFWPNSIWLCPNLSLSNLTSLLRLEQNKTEMCFK